MPPIFVVGCPRSGTTMMSELLRDSPWGAPFETHFIIKHMKALNGDLDLTQPEKFHRVVKAILRERPIMQLNLALDIEEFYESLEQYDYAHVVDQLIARHRKQQGYKSWGDKTPLYVQHCDELNNLFPDAKIIVMIRDGRDVALSLLKKDWGPSNIFSCAELWKDCYEDIENMQRLESKGLLRIVRYEEMLRNPEVVIPEVYKFLGQTLNDEFFKKSLAHVRRDNYNKWQSSMSVRQLAIFEGVAANTLEKLGYEVTHNEGDIHSLTEMFYRIDALGKRIWSLFKLNVIDEVLIRTGIKQPFGDPN